MASTKIINVQKSDEFEDVLEAFQNTSAEDVIFIFPKGSKFAKNRSHLEAIKTEADQAGKVVSIMTSDPIIANFASDYGLELLASPSTKTRGTQNQMVIKSNGDEDSESSVESEAESPEDNPDETDEFRDVESESVSSRSGENDSFSRATLAMAHSRNQSLPPKRLIRDIIRESDSNIDIEGDDNDFNLEIKKNNSLERDAEIEEVWNKKSRVRRASIFDRLSAKFKKSKSSRLYFWGIGLGIIFIIAFILYTSSTRARIIIVPQKQELDFHIKISASALNSAINSEQNQIPGQLFNAQVMENAVAPLTNQKDVVQKTRGKITIFNRGSLDQKLVATTRFESKTGLIYRIPGSINVPGAQKKDGKVIAGFIESTVYADRPGPEFNIPPSTFTIPGFKDTPKFEEFYAVSNDAMIGGIIGPAKIVTENDYNLTLENLKKRVKENIIKSLETQSGTLKIIDSIDIKFSESVVNAGINDAAEELKMTLEGSAKTIGFRTEDVLELVNNYLSKNGRWTVIPESFVLDYQNPVLDKLGKSLIFNLNFKGMVAAEINTDLVLNEVLGLSEDAIRTYFKTMKEVKEVKVVLSPFWVKRIPSDLKKVSIEVNNN